MLRYLRSVLAGTQQARHIPACKALRSRYDVVVIGGGGHGLAAAYYLAKKHRVRSVAVLEKGYLAGGNTARNTMAVRANYMTVEGTQFYKASLRLFEQLSDELDFNVMFSQRGQLTLAHSEAALRAFTYRAELNAHLGLRTSIVDRKQIAELVPALDLSESHHHPVLGGLWHPEAGMARHDAVAWGYAWRASELGVEIHQHTPVVGIEVRNGRAVGVQTPRGSIECGAVIQAVAGSSSLVAAMAGIRLPIVSYPLQALVTQPVKRFLDPMVSSAQRHCYFSQTPRGEVVIGGGSDPYPLYSTRSTLELKEELVRHSVELFPCLSTAKVLRQWAGVTDMTPDYSPIMGESPIEDYFLDSGWGTWGFKATPICGMSMAELVTSHVVPELIKPYALERFSRLELVNEMGATAASH